MLLKLTFLNAELSECTPQIEPQNNRAWWFHRASHTITWDTLKYSREFFATPNCYTVTQEQVSLENHVKHFWADFHTETLVTVHIALSIFKGNLSVSKKQPLVQISDGVSCSPAVHTATLGSRWEDVLLGNIHYCNHCFPCFGALIIEIMAFNLIFRTLFYFMAFLNEAHDCCFRFHTIILHQSPFSISVTKSCVFSSRFHCVYCAHPISSSFGCVSREEGHHLL